MQPNTLNKTANVIGYRDNPDGTTTNLLSDGSQDTGKLQLQSDGQYSFNPINSTNPTINSDVLKNTQPKLKLPEPTASTVATGIIGATEANLQQAKDNMAKQQELDVINAKNQASQAKADYSSVVDQIMGVQNSRSTLEANANIPKLSQEATDITNQIETTQRAYQNELKALDSAGLTDAGRASASRDISRKYASQLADLSIIQDVKNRNLTTAQTNIDRKIQLQLEPLKLKADYLKTIYEDNKDNLTKSEDRAFQTKIKEEDRNYKKEEDRLKILENTKLKYMDTATSIGKGVGVLSEFQKATSPEEVVAIAARNGVISLEDQYKAQQTLKLSVEKNKLLQDTNFANNPIVKDSPLVDAVFNVNAGSAEGQQKRDMQKVASLVSDGKDKQAKELIMSRVTSKMTAGERDAQLDRRNTIDALEDMKTALNEYVSLSGNTSLLKGSIEDVANKIGTTSDPRLASIKTRIVQATQKYRNSITGAAWGDQETAEYKAIFPSISNTSKLNNTIIDTMIPLLKSNEKNAIAPFLGGTEIYDTVFGDVNKNQDPLGLGIQANPKVNNPLGI